MLSEGTKTRDGEALSNALQLLGTTINASVAGETGAIGFVSTTDKVRADARHPGRHAPQLDVSRRRARTAARTAARRADAGARAAGAIASRVFPRIVFGPDHPYGRVVTEESLKAITRDDVVAFHKAYFQPGRALITVVGDIDACRGEADRSRRRWRRGPKEATGRRSTTRRYAEPKATTIFLVDKPGAAQSTFAIGRPGPPRNTPDFYALQVMNTILGGMFQSRLNANIREEKGYSYGVNSNFAFGKGPGAFRAGGDIVTREERRGARRVHEGASGDCRRRPITDEELSTAKDALIQRLPATFASVSSINGAITTLWTQNLPDDYYQQYAKADCRHHQRRCRCGWRSNTSRSTTWTSSSSAIDRPSKVR